MRIGVDLGGSKIEAMLLDNGGKELSRRRVESPVGDYPETLAAIVGLVRGIERDFALKAKVGIGIPGTISPATGLVKNANSVWLIGQPLYADLCKALDASVRLANDADCFAVSEAIDGAGVGAATVFGVILGSGVGGGICWQGVPMCGPNAIAGEWGHNPLPWANDTERPGPDCYCGKRGCLETFLSGPGLRRDYWRGSGQNASPQEINIRAMGGDVQAEETLGRYEDRLARGLATVINILDPEVIVLGGGLSNLERLYRHVPGLLAKWVFSDRGRY